ncbi:MAG: EAL domain-containing protein [Hyphomicrobiales bacterium]|nr:EAL domain-containing protein [Hyphomicrobiales bacterium]
MSIRYKTFAAFSTLVAIICLVAYLGVKGITDTGKLAAQLFEGPLIAVNYARSAQLSAKQARHLVRQDSYELADDGSIARFKELFAEIDANLAVVRKRVGHTAVADLVTDTEQKLKTWFEAELSVIDAPGEGVTALPTRFLLDQMGAEALSSLDDLIETVVARGFDDQKRAEQSVEATSTTMLFLALAGLVIGVILSIIFTRSFSEPIIAAMNTAQRVASGDFSNTIVTKRRDEFGNLLRSIGSMQSSLRQRAEEERQKKLSRQKLSQILTALNASSEAMLRAKTREELYDVVCQIMVDGGEFVSASIGIANQEADGLELVAVKGERADQFETSGQVIGAGAMGDGSIAAKAFSLHQPCVDNDYARADFTHSDDAARRFGGRSAAALPLMNRKATGVIEFQATGPDYFTPEIVELLSRLAANLSLALEDFDRAEERERAEEEVRYLATHDSLTDLPNRTLFRELLELSMNAAKRYKRKSAVLFIDLDRFKIINDTLGHEQGDNLLVEIARRLKGNVRSSDVVARLGGDEFVVLLNEITQQEQVNEISKSLLKVLCEPMELAKQQCSVSASIGVAMFPGDGEDQEELIKNADIAMYLAKQEGKNDVRFYSKNIETPSADRIRVEGHLRCALENNELFLEYQPKQSTTSGVVIGVEALLRWQSPELGLLSPMEFIPIAEETGLSIPIGQWVLRSACLQAVAWQRQGLPPLSMAVNLSLRQFSDEKLLDGIDAALAESELDPGLLQIELTESTVMINVERAIKVLDAIQSRGVRLAIDDFGTGYSSMTVMKKFPIDTIKIDRSFVQDIPNNERDKAVAKAIISMGKVLGMEVVAEGVESVAQNAFLRQHGCDEIQGFYFRKPVAPDGIFEICAQQMSKPSRRA